MKILRNDWAIAEVKPHEFSVEASDLGFPPGQWPRRLETDLGNGLDFLLWSVDRTRAIYRQANGIIVLSVFND